MQNDKKIDIRFIVLIFSIIFVFTITVVPMFGADNKIKAEFGKPILNEEPISDKRTKEETPEALYKAEIYPAAGFAILKNGGAVDNGDFYRADGRKIRLFRSLWKVAVWQKKGKQALDIEAVNNFLDKGTLLKTERSNEFTKILKTEKRMNSEALVSVLENLRQSELVQRIDPVFINEETGKEMLVTPRIVVKLAADVLPEQLEDIHQTYNAKVVGFMHDSSDEIIIDLGDAEAEEILNICEKYMQDSRVLWASPDFLFQLDLFHTPDDTLYSSQWHLNNTGQSGATFDADVDAPEAWEISKGDTSIVIAIIDTGVQITHPDLNDNIYINTAENTGTPLVDDDGNGYIDDINGWDFYGNDANPNPGSTQGHGTCCAGVAAGEGNNAEGIAGIAYNCKILPVKICSDTGTFASSTAIGNAIRYAADMADVLSNSWGGGGDDAIIHSAIQYAVNIQGKPIFFASGNYASGFYQLWVTGISAGSHTFKWEYSKDGSDSYGEDSVWVDGIVFPGGEVESFEGGTFPVGWTTGGDDVWSISTTHALTGWDGEGTSESAKAGAITHNQTTYLQTTKLVGAGDLSFYIWLSSEYGHDFFDFHVGASHEFHYSGVPLFIDYNVAYPARYPECIAVGASTDYDYRSDYSQYDETLSHVLNIVAPSSGGNLGIATTDITAAGGYDSGDYTDTDAISGFGGTSSACPLAAGIAALLLSKEPTLTPNEIKATLCISADKIGNIVYDTDGYNKYYGYGKVNADEALGALTQPLAHIIYATAGSHGSISPAGDIVVVSNDDQAFTITADADYLINDVVVDGISQGDTDTYTFENVTTGHTITASFVSTGGEYGGDDDGYGGDGFDVGSGFSSGGSGRGSSGCFIATACYGTAMTKELKVLSEFRDEILLTNPVGTVFVNAYYKISPPMADFISEHPMLKNAVKGTLKPLIWIAKKFED